jgi:glycosyltransferase involved in cell wall biosynthesis
MKTIDIIVDGGWILRRMAEEVEKWVSEARIPIVAYRSDMLAKYQDGDALYYMNYCWYDEAIEKPAAVYFTHFRGNHAQFDKVWMKAATLSDLQICISEKTADIVRSQGGKNVHVIWPGVDRNLRRTKPVFGVCGAVKDDRKGAWLVEKMVAQGYSVRAWGTGWPCKIVSDDLAHLPEFYSSIDYLVVTSNLEGGPMPVIEAIAMGVPVIAPDVGWCWEFPVIRYEVDSWNSLSSVLVKLAKPPTWKEWGLEHRRLLRTLL